jgi:hypothetical protein
MRKEARIEDVPVVAQETAETATKDEVLGMRVTEFFTAARFKDAGVDDAIANRMTRYIGQAMDRPYEKTVRDFLDRYGFHLRQGGPTFLPNAGRKSKNAVRAVLAKVGLY